MTIITKNRKLTVNRYNNLFNICVTNRNKNEQFIEVTTILTPSQAREISDYIRRELTELNKETS